MSHWLISITDMVYRSVSSMQRWLMFVKLVIALPQRSAYFCQQYDIIILS